ncbi:hypothetical protein BDZ45DRAFT_132945 [Acephala macrosclerotiorum]|nr:hypothetical protein BDZ45DRAFT_132945 [Acephala macrosclerotiorum]
MESFLWVVLSITSLGSAYGLYAAFFNTPRVVNRNGKRPSPDSPVDKPKKKAKLSPDAAPFAPPGPTSLGAGGAGLRGVPRTPTSKHPVSGSSSSAMPPPSVNLSGSNAGLSRSRTQSTATLEDSAPSSSSTSPSSDHAPFEDFNVVLLKVLQQFTAGNMHNRVGGLFAMWVYSHFSKALNHCFDGAPLVALEEEAAKIPDICQATRFLYNTFAAAWYSTQDSSTRSSAVPSGGLYIPSRYMQNTSGFPSRPPHTSSGSSSMFSPAPPGPTIVGAGGASSSGFATTPPGPTSSTAPWFCEDSWFENSDTILDLFNSTSLPGQDISQLGINPRVNDCPYSECLADALCTPLAQQLLSQIAVIMQNKTIDDPQGCVNVQTCTVELRWHCCDSSHPHQHTYRTAFSRLLMIATGKISGRSNILAFLRKHAEGSHTCGVHCLTPAHVVPESPNVNSERNGCTLLLLAGEDPECSHFPLCEPSSGTVPGKIRSQVNIYLTEFHLNDLGQFFDKNHAPPGPSSGGAGGAGKGRHAAADDASSSFRPSPDNTKERASNELLSESEDYAEPHLPPSGHNRSMPNGVWKSVVNGVDRFADQYFRENGNYLPIDFRPYQCPFSQCMQSFPVVKHYLNHLNRFHHLNVDDHQKNQLKGYVCHQCGESWGSSRSKELHIEKTECRYNFGSPGSKRRVA